jgi:hypothetical protein
MIREYFENLYPNKLRSIEEMCKFLEAFDSPILTQKDLNHSSRSITSNEIEAVIKGLPTRKTPEPDGFMAEFDHIFKEELTPMLKCFIKQK